MNEKLRQMLEAEADRRFEEEVVDKLRARRLLKLVPRDDEQQQKSEDEMSPEDAAILEAEFEQGNAVA